MNHLSHFFATPDSQLNLVEGYHHMGMVALSILVPILMSMMALHTARMARITASKKYKRTALTISALALGVGIWVMHFIAMMAFVLPVPVSYDALPTLVSILPACAASGIALRILAQQKRPTAVQYIISGLFVGSGIGLMHYIGMIAFGLSSITLTIGVMTVALNGWVRSRELYNEMQHNKSRLQALLDTTVDPIVAINEFGIIQDFNKAAVNLLGYQSEEVIGKNVKMLMPDPYRSEHDSYLKNYRTTQKAKIIGTGREVMAQHKEGHCIPIRLAVGKVHSSQSHCAAAGVCHVLISAEKSTGTAYTLSRSYAGLLPRGCATHSAGAE